ncbi:MAG: nitroreductase family protein [Bacillota bacterium]
MLEAIEKRTSVRSYLKKPLSDADQKAVKEILDKTESLKGPFGNHATFFFVDQETKEGEKIGTYGFIKNPPHFIGGVVKNQFKALVDYGFLFESIILKLTARSIGTVWLGGTFKRDQFDIPKEDDEIIPCVSPVGYSAKKSLREHVIRTVSKGDARKPFDALFFRNNNKAPLKDNHPYREYLEAVRVAPSASNKQPWRIIVDDDACHVYLDRTSGYGKGLPFDIQAVDIGIAIYHLAASLEADNQSVSYHSDKPYDLNDTEYVLSVTINK